MGGQGGGGGAPPGGGGGGGSFFEGSGSVSNQSSDLAVRELEGIFGGGKKRAKSRALGGQLEEILKGIGTGSEVGGAFQEELLRPQFGPRSGAEQSLLDAISQQTQGASSLRGLGPSTQGGLAQNIAPALVGLQQQRSQQLGQGAQFEQSRRQQALQGLFELIGLASPQVVAGQEQRGKDISGSLSF